MTYKRPRPRTKYSGVYGIVCRVTGEAYIGSSVDMTGRWTHHRYTLRRNKHKTPALQACWNQHGESAFAFVVLERCASTVLRDRETSWIKASKMLGCLNWGDSAAPAHTGESEVKKRAARQRWARPEYRAKREEWLATRGSDGRFLPRDPADNG